GVIRTLTPESLQIMWQPSAPASFVKPMAIGDSIAVDGICLTVTKILPDSFWAAVSPETSQRTILGYRQPNAVVNLEASLRVGSKIGGHFVTGHIDGVGYLQSSTQTANAWEMRFTVSDPRVARYIVSKGSVAVNGISLTIADCDRVGSWFTVAVIPLTYAETNLQHLTPTDPVNLEGDVLGKYVEKFLGIAAHSGASSNVHSDPRGMGAEKSSDRALEEFSKMGKAMGMGLEPHESTHSPITDEFLSEHGYT
ncbi:MAG: riboflavin synthase, partial [Merismopedia sp. SIO2A8]|nr:riboflavin synthase [Merismopedia sp. SIO2A8]